MDAALIAKEKALEGPTNIRGRAGKGIELANVWNAQLSGIEVEVATGPLLRMANVTGSRLEGGDPLPPRPPATTRSTMTRAARRAPGR